jgi:hypothetical protein
MLKKAPMLTTSCPFGRWHHMLMQRGARERVRR